MLNCDASEKGLGAVLYEHRDGKPRVVSYWSRTLNDAERNYHLHSGKLEFLCLKWAVTEKFADYLGYDRFDVFTDNNQLTYVMSTAKLNATGLRWVELPVRPSLPPWQTKWWCWQAFQIPLEPGWDWAYLLGKIDLGGSLFHHGS
jgi:hypothetical protein